MTAIRTETEAAELMMRYGIVRVRVDQFHCNGWRYSSLGDAVAEGMRGQRRQANEAAPASAKIHLDGLLLTEGKT
jgi:hypothetical protein